MALSWGIGAQDIRKEAWKRRERRALCKTRIMSKQEIMAAKAGVDRKVRQESEEQFCGKQPSLFIAPQWRRS